jgi:hypothetical protein
MKEKLKNYAIFLLTAFLIIAHHSCVYKEEVASEKTAFEAEPQHLICSEWNTMSQYRHPDNLLLGSFDYCVGYTYVQR